MYSTYLPQLYHRYIYIIYIYNMYLWFRTMIIYELLFTHKIAYVTCIYVVNQYAVFFSHLYRLKDVFNQDMSVKTMYVFLSSFDRVYLLLFKNYYSFILVDPAYYFFFFNKLQLLLQKCYSFLIIIFIFSIFPLIICARAIGTRLYIPFVRSFAFFKIFLIYLFYFVLLSFFFSLQYLL